MALMMAFYQKQIPRIKNRNLGYHSLVVLFFFGIVLAVCSTEASCAEVVGLDTTKDNWTLVGGYGQSFPGWGQTSQRVETVDLILGYNHRIFDNPGSGWDCGYLSFLVELPVSFTVSPDVSTMVGVNFLAAYTFTANQQWQPYLFGGGGPVYSFADIPEMGAELNGNYQFGIGVKYPWHHIHQLLFELRYHHISNAGTKEPNDPLNSVKFLIGFTF